jgi:hypothetical protein
MAYLLVFHVYINEMHGSRNKIPGKKISSGNIAWWDLIPALEGYHPPARCGHFCDHNQGAMQHVIKY